VVITVVAIFIISLFGLTFSGMKIEEASPTVLIGQLLLEN